jgi:hypothetical protein
MPLKKSLDAERPPQGILWASCTLFLQICNTYGTRSADSSPSLFYVFPGVQIPQTVVPRACDDFYHKITESPKDNDSKFNNPLENLLVIWDSSKSKVIGVLVISHSPFDHVGLCVQGNFNNRFLSQFHFSILTAIAWPELAYNTR